MPRALLFAAGLSVVACTPDPVIESFTASAEVVPFGGQVQLNWSVRHTTSVELEPLGPVSGPSALVEVRQPTTFVLVARGPEGGKAVRSAPLTVNTAPRVQALSGVYNSGRRGLAVTLFLVDATGRPPAQPFEARIERGGAVLARHTCAAGSTVCIVPAPLHPPEGGGTVAFEAFGGAHALNLGTLRDTLMAQPGPVEVTSPSATLLRARFRATTGAVEYRAQAFDLVSEARLGDPVISPLPDVTVTLPAPRDPSRRYGIWVEASNTPFRAAELPSARAAAVVGRGVGALDLPGGHAIVLPAQFTGGTMTASVPALKQHERVAVLVFNADRAVVGRDDYDGAPAFPNDRLTFEVSASGLPAPTPVELPQPAESFLDGLWANPHHGALHDELLRLNAEDQEQVAAERARQPHPSGPTPAGQLAVLNVPPATRTFCVLDTATRSFQRRAATKRHETATAAFYVDDADLADFQNPADLWQRLGERWEAAIFPQTTRVFGAVSDVDANGKIFVVFSSMLGGPGGRGIVVGYFIARDVMRPLDTSTNCTGSGTSPSTNVGSNAGDIVYMNTVANLTGTGRTRDGVLRTLIPGTLAHELQHLINQQQRCPVGGTSCVREEIFINEGLSMVAEDGAGYGWHLLEERRIGARYLDRIPGDAKSHINSSLTVWSGDPVGNYQGSKAFFRHLWDRFGEATISAIARSATGGISNIEARTAVGFNRLLVDFGTGLAFSNEAFTPAQVPSFSGPWAPLHEQVGYVNWQAAQDAPLQLPLRINGWGATLTAPGSGGDVTITVRSPSTIHRPHVAIVRFTGVLPRCADTQVCIP